MGDCRLLGPAQTLCGGDAVSAVRPPILRVEPKEVQQALETVSQALSPLKERKAVTWILNRGFDDIAVWRTIWEQKVHHPQSVIG